MEPRRRDERDQLLDALVGNSRPAQIPAQPLEVFAVTSGDTHAGVEVEAVAVSHRALVAIDNRAPRD
jgi:hypothetical protein